MAVANATLCWLTSENINEGQSTISTTALSVELSTFLNCDLTLIYLLLWARPKAQKGVGGLETREKQG
jgi:hypothetical protein